MPSRGVAGTPQQRMHGLCYWCIHFMVVMLDVKISESKRSYIY
jgi:hypothetical protein